MPYEPKDATPATVRVNRDAVTLYDLDDRYDYIADEATAPDTVNPSQIQLDGDRSVLDAFARLIDEFDPNFNIVTP